MGQRGFPHAAVYRGVALFGLYLVLAVASTWPLAANLRGALPLGTQTAATVPLFGAWTFWWNADRITSGYQGYWDAPIFYPAQQTFAISEPMPLTALAAPLAISGPVFSYNVMLLAALTGNGWVAFRLFRRLHFEIVPAAVGGAMVEMLPFVHSELGAFQLVPICGILWTLARLHAFAAEPNWQRAGLLSISFAVTYYLCTYYALFLSVLLPITGVWLLGAKLVERRTWVLLALSAGLVVILTSPILSAQLRVRHQYDMQRSEQLVQQLSATLNDYRHLPWKPLVFGRPLSDAARPHIRLSVGVVMGCLAIAGAIFGLRRRRSRTWTACCLTMLLAALLLSLGPNLRLWNWSPYSLLIAWFPGFAQARNVYRFALFVQLALAFLCVNCLQQLWKLRVTVRYPVRAQLVPVAVLLLAFVATVEVWPPAQNLYQLPSVERNGAWLNWLKQETPSESVIVCVPFPTGKREADYEETALWMVWGTIHQRRMVNGYSGFFPPTFLALKADMVHFPDATSLAHLQRVGVRYCVVRQGIVAAETSDQSAEWPASLQLEFRDDLAGIDIYRIVNAP